MSAGKAPGSTVAAVTGASGFIGDSLVAGLLTRYRVRALFRAPSERSGAQKGRCCEIVIGDLDSERALAALVGGASHVYHCAATMVKSEYIRIIGSTGT